MLYPIYDREQRANKPFIRDLLGTPYSSYSYSIMTSDDLILESNVNKQSYRPAMYAINDTREYIENTIFNSGVQNRLFLVANKGGFKFTDESSISVYNVGTKAYTTKDIFETARRDNISLNVFTLNSDSTKGDYLCSLPCFYSDDIDEACKAFESITPSDWFLWNITLGIKYQPNIVPAPSKWNSSFNATKVFVSMFPRDNKQANTHPDSFYRGTLDSNIYGTNPKPINTDIYFSCGVNKTIPPPNNLRYLFLPIDPWYPAADQRYGNMTYPNFMPISYDNNDTDEVDIPPYLEFATFYSRGQGLVARYSRNRDDINNPTEWNYILTFPYSIGTAQRIEGAQTSFRDSLFPFFTGFKVVSNSYAFITSSSSYINSQYPYTNSYYFEFYCPYGKDLSNKYVIVMTSGVFDLINPQKFVANAYFGSEVLYPPKPNKSCRTVFTENTSKNAGTAGRKYTANAKIAYTPYNENAIRNGGCGTYGK